MADKFMEIEKPDGSVSLRKVDLETWSRQFESLERWHLLDQFDGGEVEVSTVFLGLDHSFGHGEPMVYETMVFGGKHDGEQWRYSTREEAIKGHAHALKLVKDYLLMADDTRARHRHGTYSRYRLGKCRCAQCRAANVDQTRKIRARRKAESRCASCGKHSGTFLYCETHRIAERRRLKVYRAAKRMAEAK